MHVIASVRRAVVMGNTDLDHGPRLQNLRDMIAVLVLCHLVLE
jgi:hypothetical protein